MGTLVYGQWECKMVQLLWKTVWRVLKKLNTKLPCDSAALLHGIYSEKLKTGIQRLPVHFHSIIYNSQKAEPMQVYSKRWRINKIWYINTMKYFSAIERNETLIHTATWMDLENFMLTKINQTLKEEHWQEVPTVVGSSS